MGWRAALLLGLLAGAGGLVALLAYCLRFDRQRRARPDFQRRLREKRRKEREQAKKCETELQEQRATATIEKFFLQEIQLGELWLAKGQHEKGIEHLTNAVSVSNRPVQVMRILEQTLPPQIFEMLVDRIPYMTQRFESALDEPDPPYD